MFAVEIMMRAKKSTAAGVKQVITAREAPNATATLHTLCKRQASGGGKGQCS